MDTVAAFRGKTNAMGTDSSCKCLARKDPGTDFMDFSGRGHTIYIRKAQSTAFSVILAIVGFGE